MGSDLCICLTLLSHKGTVYRHTKAPLEQEPGRSCPGFSYASEFPRMEVSGSPLSENTLLLGSSVASTRGNLPLVLATRNFRLTRNARQGTIKKPGWTFR